MTINFILKRKELGLTQRDIAKILDITTQTVSNWETRYTTPKLTIEQIEQLCILFKTDIHGLKKLFEVSHE